MEGRTMSSRSSVAVLSQALAEKCGMSQSDAEIFIKQMFEVASTSLQTEKLLKMRWLGTFKVMMVKDRESIDVNTGDRIVIGGREKISFTPDSILKEIVNKPFSQFETVVVNDGVDFSEIDNKFSLQKVSEDVTEDVSEDVAGDVTENVSENVTKEVPEAPSTVEYATDEVIVLGDVSFDKKNIAEDEHTEEATIPLSEEKEDDTAVLESLSSDDQEIKKEEVVASAMDDTETSNDTDTAGMVVADVVKSETTDVCVSPTTDVDTAGVGDDTGEGNDNISNGNDGNDNANDENVKDGDANGADSNDDDENHNGGTSGYFKLPRWVLPVSAAVLVLLLVCVGWIGFNYGKIKMERNLLEVRLKSYETKQKASDKKAPQDAQTAEMLRKSREDSLRMVQASEAVAQAEKSEGQEDKAEKENEQSAADKTSGKTPVNKADNKSIATDKVKPTAEKKEAAKPVADVSRSVDEEKTAKSSAQYDKDPRVRTGAYRIVGVASTVTVKKGQTMKSISRLHLGEGMECYVEAINGTKTVQPGQQLKIPKLQLKKKLK